LDKHEEDLLKDPETRTITLEMTDERCERLERAHTKVVELLRASTKGPLEGYTVLQHVMEEFREIYGIAKVVDVPKGAGGMSN